MALACITIIRFLVLLIIAHQDIARRIDGLRQLINLVASPRQVVGKQQGARGTRVCAPMGALWCGSRCAGAHPVHTGWLRWTQPEHLVTLPRATISTALHLACHWLAHITLGPLLAPPLGIASRWHAWGRSNHHTTTASHGVTPHRCDVAKFFFRVAVPSTPAMVLVTIPCLS